ncbi:MAG TPA: rhodanese-like domain-containing protein [Flavipsychrobacter sp.]|nr:rhodanese-like domain-containing protein [Flavipsychrobacter sp.]
MSAKKMTVVDVRSREEYASGHVVDSLNIPVNELQNNIEKLKEIEGDIVLCCASGMRSSMARQLLVQQGLTNVADGGPWTNVQYKIVNNLM